MKLFRPFLIVCALGAIFTTLPAAAQQDIKNSKDHPLVGRYEGAFIRKYVQKGYEELVLPVKAITRKNKDNAGEWAVSLAGKLTRITYEGPAERSALEVVRNFQQKLEGDGFTTVFYCRQKDCGLAADFWKAGAPEGSLQSNWDKTVYAILKKADPAGDVWVSTLAVEFGGTGSKPLTPQVAVNVVEVQPIETDKIVVRDASAMQQAIASEGRVALYGIYFDFDKADLKPESDPQLEEIAKLLKGQTGLKVLVVGHTDAKGALDYNLDLSQRRAASVVGALVGRFGIDAGRITPVGVGMAAPVATNATDEGRARNRRVEIVEQF